MTLVYYRATLSKHSRFLEQDTTCACQIDAEMGDVDIEDGEIAGEINVLPENVADDEVCCEIVIPSTA